jgi:hypothetical protein
MRRIAMLVGAVALLTMLFAGVAMARNFQCSDRPCEGTPEADTIFERGGNTVGDTIYGRPGPDTIRADTFTNDNDFLFGQRGHDTLNAQDGDPNDILDGGRGFDVCIGDVGDTFRDCEDIEETPLPPM